MIRIRRSLLPAMAVTAAATLSAACGSAASADKEGATTELRYQGSVGNVTLPELAQDLGYLGKIKLKWVGNTISGPQDIQSAATGQTDFGGAFNGAIVKLVSAKAPIKAVIGYYGSDKDTYIGYYVKDGSPIKSARDLIGKKIGVNTLGAHLEAALKEYLKRGGLTPAEIKQVQLVVVPPVNTEQALRQGQIDVGALNGILRDKAIDRGGIHPLFKDTELFGDFTAGSYVFRADFLKNNPATVRVFVGGVAKAIEWARSTPRDQVIARFHQIAKKRGRNEDTSALRYFKGYGVAGKGGVIADTEFKTWVDWLKREGELTRTPEPADLFTNDYNPFKPGGTGG